jgi:hypothetical protein
MGIVMQLLIERANFRTTPRRENCWQGRKLARDIQSQHEPFVNHVGATELAASRVVCVDMHIDVDNLVRHNGERLRFRAHMPAHAPLHIENIIAWG